MNKQCGSCRYATRKPPKAAACSGEGEAMKYNGKNMPYCDSYKAEYKGKS